MGRHCGLSILLLALSAAIPMTAAAQVTTGSIASDRSVAAPAAGTASTSRPPDPRVAAQRGVRDEQLNLADPEAGLPAALLSPVGREPGWDAEIDPKPLQPLPPPSTLTLAVVQWPPGKSSGTADRSARTAVWRNTFGAERTTPPPLDPQLQVAPQADVVVILGVQEVATIRRAFPARGYFVGFSRPSSLAAQASGVTAIAVRRGTGLRLGAIEQVAMLTDPDAALLTRIGYPGGGVWIRVAGRLGECLGAATSSLDCHLDTDAEDWLAGRASTGDAALAFQPFTDRDPRRAGQASAPATTRHLIGGSACGTDDRRSPAIAVLAAGSAWTAASTTLAYDRGPCAAALMLTRR